MRTTPHEEGWLGQSDLTTAIAANPLSTTSHEEGWLGLSIALTFASSTNFQPLLTKKDGWDVIELRNLSAPLSTTPHEEGWLGLRCYGYTGYLPFQPLLTKKDGWDCQRPFGKRSLVNFQPLLTKKDGWDIGCDHRT